MSTTTEDRTEAAETTAEDRLPYHPEDWPEEFREFLDRLPDVDQELSDIISEMEGLLALADTSLLIYMNARNIRSGDSEAGKLDYRKARMISPMREEAAKFVWLVYRRVDAFYDLLQEYECEAQEEALRLSAALRNGGGTTASAETVPADAASADLDHGLAWEAITVLALAERLAMDFGHRFVGKRMLHELAEVRHRIEDEIGVDGELSDGIVDHARDRYGAILREARGEVES